MIIALDNYHFSGISLSAMQKNKIHLIHNAFDIIYLIIGPIVAAIGIALFYTPAKITSGGASGVANILYNLFGFDLGLVTFFVNLPLIAVGIFVFGLKYSLKTFIGSTLLSFWVSFFGNLTGYTGFLDVTEPVNILLSAIFGGVLLGTGIGITMKSGCNTGGTDIIAQTIAHYTPIAVGTVSFCFNGLVVGASGYFIGFQPMLFSIIGMFCSSFMVNYVLTGIGTRRSKTVYVISDDIATIGKRVVNELKRSGTVWEATGFYTGKKHKILLVLVQNHQYQRLLRIINQEDPTAFVYVGEAYRVLGKGFAPLRKIADTTVAED